MSTHLIAIREGKLLVDAHTGALPACPLPEPEAEGEAFDLTDAGGNCYRALRVSGDTPRMAGKRWMGLREAFHSLGINHWRMTAKGVELLNWAADNRHCGRCGGVMARTGPISLQCTSCRNEQWPRLSPCVMVLVKRGEEALLVHAKSFSRPFFGLVAGFIETGETPEECVRREVKEETGIEVSDIRYIESQSWPFPAQLMLGFTARCAPDATPQFLDGEIAEGGFFPPERDSLPPLPTHPSLARTLIESWLAGKLG